MDLSKPLIINAELFLQCAGNCSGCFLTQDERFEENTHLENIKAPILSLLEKEKNYSAIILGFGRGNILNLSQKGLNSLLEFMKLCESSIVDKEKIIYEVSTSLIGKIDSQIEKALYLIERNKKIYLNVVINSEITSTNFWNNWEKLYSATSEKRKSWGWKDNFGDILVLNINPKSLPNLELLNKHIHNKGSPFNISLFPFVEEEISNDDLLKLNNWSNELLVKFKGKDLNIKNYLNLLKTIDIDNNINDMLNYHHQHMNSYYFVDKNGYIVEGSLSIMGEVDYIRLKEKFSINPNIINAFKIIQKNKVCSSCEYQKECLLSGAYLNMLHNSDKIKDSKYCLSGYQSLFRQAQSDFNASVS